MYIIETNKQLELSKKYVQKRKLRVNLLKTKITTYKESKGSFDVI
jgi:hypothetical protein